MRYVIKEVSFHPDVDPKMEHNVEEKVYYLVLQRIREAVQPIWLAVRDEIKHQCRI